jgi:cytochrome P450
MTTTHPTNRPFPGPGRFIPTADLMALRDSPLDALVKIARTYGDLFQYPVGFWTIHFLNHPDSIRHILVDNHKNYSKDTFQYNLLGGVAGRGLLTNDGDSWLHQRRLAQPAFHRERLVTLGADMTNFAAQTAERWDTFAQEGQPIDIDAEMMTLTLNIVGQSLFGVDFARDADELVAAVITTLDHVIYRALNPFALPNSIPTPRNRRFRAARRRLDEAIFALIAHRRTHPADHHDLLEMLMSAQDEETGERMSDAQLRDEIITLIIAGHETVASALTWTWYFLAKQPDILRTLQAELDTVLGGRLPTVADLPALAYTRMVFEETLRVYPPAWIITRRAIHSDTVGGYTLPANALVVISPYVTHRHPDFWEHPDAFDPERFSPEQQASRPRYAYFPFGGGPRLCIGNQYSYMEAQLVLATLAQRFTPTLLSGHPVAVQPLVTLRPKREILMHLHRR